MKPKLMHALSVVLPLFFADAAPRCGGSNRPERPLPPSQEGGDTTGGETSGLGRGGWSDEPGSALVGGVDWLA